MAREPGSIGGIAVANPADPRLHGGTVRADRTHVTNNVGSGPLTVRHKSDPHHATEA